MTTSKLHVLDLFSGIGGFSLGLERTRGFRTVAFCEIHKHAQKVLKKHWPHVPIYNDVTLLTWELLKKDGLEKIDVITGGFPCQDLSVAGKQAGIEASRSGLWSEIKRLASEIRPRYIIVENVADLLRGPSRQPGQWFGRVLGDLAEIGYDAEWHCIPASSIGAPHRRDRVWIIAYAQSERREETGKLQYERLAQWFSGRRKASFLANSHPQRVQGGKPQTISGLTAFSWCENVRSVEDLRNRTDIPEPLFRGSCDGVSHWVDRIAECGNALVPQIPEIIGYAILEGLEAEQRVEAGE